MSKKSLNARADAGKAARREAQRVAAALDCQAARTNTTEAPAPHRAGVGRKLVRRDVFCLAAGRGGPVPLPECRA
jgi:hypothetical protein